MSKRSSARDVVPPTLDEDAAERKRVLNILAQRRYRRRKKERLQTLESRTQGRDSERHVSQETEQCTTSSSHEARTAERVADTNFTAGVEDTLPHMALDVNGQDADNHSAHAVDTLSPAVFNSFPADLDSAFFSELPDLVMPATRDMRSERWQDVDHLNLELQNFDTQLAVQHLGGSNSPYDNCAELQTHDTLYFAFPDDRILEVPSLTLLNAAVKVAQRLKINELIWDFSAISPFYQNQTSSSSTLSPPSLTTSQTSPESSHPGTYSSTPIDELPPHLRPTPTQCSVPHHPILDLLPWPSTRDKLIQVFTLPVELRPESARDSMALLQLVQDLEDDGGEGVRINGQDPFQPRAWEIGQVLLERWWWALDYGAIQSSSRAREKRGQRPLALVGRT